MQVNQVTLDESRESLLALLRTKGLSIKYMDEEKKGELRQFLVLLHNDKGMSLNDVAKLIGNKTSGYTSWLFRQLGVKCRPFEEARLRGIREKRRKYERKPFDGSDEDRAYLLGLRHGDLSVSRPWKDVVRVSTSTTHPAMSELFHSLFDPYGHVYQHPRYKKDTKSYEWNLQVIVDNTFDFLLEDRDAVWKWVAERESTLLAYLAGFLDAEGTISINAARLLISMDVAYYNTNVELITFVFHSLKGLGFRPSPPYLDKKRGFVTPGYHIEMKRDYWRVVLSRFEECKRLLGRLPIKHREKVQKRTLALGLALGQSWIEVGPRVQGLRMTIKASRDAFVAEAQRVYLANPRHQMP